MLQVHTYNAIVAQCDYLYTQQRRQINAKYIYTQHIRICESFSMNYNTLIYAHLWKYAGSGKDSARARARVKLLLTKQN